MTTTEAPTVGTLSPFDGRPVLRSTIQVTKAGDGLSEALKVDPKELHHDEEVYVVLKCRVSRVLFKPLEKDSEYLIRVHTLEAGDATLVDAELVGPLVAEQAERIYAAKEAERLAREKEQGVQRIAFTDEETALALAHARGEHEEPDDGCPVCDGRRSTPELNEDGHELGSTIEGGGERSDDEEPEAVVYRRNHMAGNHEDEAVIGCPICDAAALDAALTEGG